MGTRRTRHERHGNSEREGPAPQREIGPFIFPLAILDSPRQSYFNHP
jgi:hypothetical protein